MSEDRTDSVELGETQLATPTDQRAAAPAAVPAQIGRFRVTGVIGEGGMGVVYAAEDEVLGRKVAVKLLHPHTGDAEARSLAEARALARLAHPNVVTVHEVGTHDGAVYVAMEFVVGTTLKVWLETERPWRERLAVIVQAGRGLSAAHAAGLVHRDFKPDNVLVGDDGRVRVLDFGLAIDERIAGGVEVSDREAGSGRLTRSGALVGTPLYMAPEQWVADPTDPRTDQFALCLVLYEALCGERAFAGATLGELRAAVLDGRVRAPARTAVPDAVHEAVRRGLASDPDHRHASVDALLAAVIAGARPRRRRVLAAVATLALVAATGVVLAAWPDDVAGPTPGPYDAILAASGLPAVQPAPRPDDPMQVTVDRLSNGLTVYISPERSKPRIHAAVVVRGGSLRDPPGVTGVNHMLGHLLIKGTGRVGTIDFAAEQPHLERIAALYRELAGAPARRAELLAAIDAENVAAARFAIPNESVSAMSALGATSINSSTDRDWTRSIAELPSNRLDAWAALEADRWTGTVFRQYPNEVGAVLEELRGQAAGSRVLDAVMAAAFAGHPYAANPIGAPADVAAQPYAALEEVFATWFVPNNAAIVLVGDVDRERALPVLERAFGAWKPRALPEAAPPRPPPLTAATTLRLPSSGERGAILLWRTPPAGHPDEPVLDVIERLLGDPQSGLLQGRVAAGELAAAGVGASFLRAAGDFVIATTPGPERDAASTVEVIDALLAALARGEVSQGAIDEVIRDVGREPPGERAAARRRHQLVDAYATGRAWADVVEAPRRMAAVRPADVARVVTAYLGAVRVVALVEPGELLPLAIDRPSLSPVTFADQPHSAWVRALLAAEAVPIEPRFLWPGRDFTRTAGPAGPVIAVRDERSDRFWLRLTWEIGDHQLRGLCAAIDGERLSDDPAATARRQSWHQLGLELTVECTATSAAIEVIAAEPRLDDAWRAIDTWLQAPAPGPAELEVRLRRYREQLRQITAEPGWRWRALLAHATAGADHPSLAFMRGDAHADLTGADLAAALATLRTAPRATLYVGPRPDRVAALAASVSVAASSPAPLAIPTLRPARPRIVVLDERARETAQLQAVFPVAPLAGDRLLRAELLESYLQGDGLSNLLSDALRAERGLVYSSEFRVVPGGRPDEPADLMLSLVAPPGRAVTALEVALPLLRAGTPDPTLVDQARAALDARYRADWLAGREIAHAVRSWIRAGHDGDPRLDRFGRLHLLGADDLAAVFAELATAPMILAIAGDASKLDMARLRELGDVTVLTPVELTDR